VRLRRSGAYAEGESVAGNKSPASPSHRRRRRRRRSSLATLSLAAPKSNRKLFIPIKINRASCYYSHQNTNPITIGPAAATAGARLLLLLAARSASHRSVPPRALASSARAVACSTMAATMEQRPVAA
jgi:hypothetical protein